MKALKVRFLAVLTSVLVSFGMMAQINLHPDLQYYRLPGFDGLNVFETPKTNDVTYDGFKVRLGADFALQFQGLSHENSANNLIEIGTNVNLPTANLNIDAQLLNGMRVHLRTYLSARHHNESWVKGGYIQIDRLDFIREGYAEGLMDVLTVRAGVDQINYGDAHFRRSDNAMAIYNPFVGNYIMDAFTTEPFIEANIMPGDLVAVVGLSNGLLNPTVSKTQTSRATGRVTGVAENKVTFYAKLGWDSQISEDLRVRITGSFYNAPGYDNGNHLYGGDRAGGRYYKVFDYLAPVPGDTTGTQFTVRTNDFSARFNPRFSNEMAFQINPFVKFKGLEFFGIYEQTSGLNSPEGFEKGSYTQLGAELLYRFGSWEQFYVAGRYNQVSGNGQYAVNSNQPEKMIVDRINFGAGWFITKNTLVKLEYVSQNYNDQFSGNLNEAKMNGVVLEAVIGF